MGKPSRKARRKKRNKAQGGNVRNLILAYVQRHPDADYFQTLRALHNQGVNINRNGSGLLMAYWKAAKKSV